MITLNRLLEKDENAYIHKHNENYGTLEDTVNAVLANQQAQTLAYAGPGAAFKALFGSSVSVIGAASYGCTTSSTDLLVAAGYCWKPSVQTVVSSPSTATLHFVGSSAGTYYVTADATGAPTFSLTDDGNALHSVVWTGSAFGTITRLAQVVWGADDDIAAQVSTALGATYDTLDERLEAGEALAVAGQFPVADSTAVLKGSSDATKQVKFEVDGLTTATTRTVTVPDKSGTMAMLDDLTGGGGFGTQSANTIFAGPSSGSAAAPTFRAPVAADINGLQGTGLTAGDVGFRTIPQNSQSTAYTTVAADSGKHILHPAADTTARTFTIDSNANVAYPIGTAITFVNEHGAGVVTIAITSDTMRLAGAGTTGSRTLAADGVATAIKITSTSWIISGSGLT